MKIQKRKFIRYDYTNPQKEARVNELKSLINKTNDSRMMEIAIILAIEWLKVKKKVVEFLNIT